MSEHFVPAVAVAIVVISASAAKADDLYIWDSRGTQIGTFVYDNLLRRQFTDKIWREVGFWRNGLDANVSFFIRPQIVPDRDTSIGAHLRSKFRS